MEGVKKGAAPFSGPLLFRCLDLDQLRRIATIELAHVLVGEIPDNSRITVDYTPDHPDRFDFKATPSGA